MDLVSNLQSNILFNAFCTWYSKFIAKIIQKLPFLRQVNAAIGYITIQTYTYFLYEQI
jgi:hypothetical protein